MFWWHHSLSCPRWNITLVWQHPFWKLLTCGCVVTGTECPKRIHTQIECTSSQFWVSTNRNMSSHVTHALARTHAVVQTRECPDWQSWIKCSETRPYTHRILSWRFVHWGQPAWAHWHGCGWVGCLWIITFPFDQKGWGMTCPIRVFSPNSTRRLFIIGLFMESISCKHRLNSRELPFMAMHQPVESCLVNSLQTHLIH